MKTASEYIRYWDEWHKEWKRIESKIPGQQDLNYFSKQQFDARSVIKKDLWTYPENKEGITNYFPEPYWGDLDIAEDGSIADLHAIFLNINPGGGGPCQDISLQLPHEKSILYDIYEHKKLYSETVRKLSRNTCYSTTNWFQKKRVEWLKKINIDDKGSKPFDGSTVRNIFCADLIPWHTDQVNGFVTSYIDKHSDLIIERVIDPVCMISHHAILKKIVIAKGVNTLSILEKKFMSGDRSTYERSVNNTTFKIDIFHYNGCHILVFSGGQGMNLPDPDMLYTLRSSSTVMDDREMSINEIFRRLSR